MKDIKTILGVFIIIMCTPVVAMAASPGSWTPGSEIQNVFIEGTDENPLVTITLVDDPSDDYKPSECPSHFLSASLTTEKGASLLSVLLAAKMASKSISFSFTSCSGTRPLIKLIRLN